MAADGSGVIQRTSSPAHELDPAWSPDGHELVGMVIPADKKSGATSTYLAASTFILVPLDGFGTDGRTFYCTIGAQEATSGWRNWRRGDPEGPKENAHRCHGWALPLLGSNQDSPDPGGTSEPAELQQLAASYAGSRHPMLESAGFMLDVAGARSHKCHRLPAMPTARPVRPANASWPPIAMLAVGPRSSRDSKVALTRRSNPFRRLVRP